MREYLASFCECSHIAREIVFAQSEHVAETSPCAVARTPPDQDGLSSRQRVRRIRPVNLVPIAPGHKALSLRLVRPIDVSDAVHALPRSPVEGQGVQLFHAALGAAVRLRAASRGYDLRT